MEEHLSPALVEKLIVPAVVGIVGWFIKDYLFAIHAKRDELVRKEWERRLLEVWSPLYYWSGIVLLDGKERGWERHGLDELEALLAKSGYLLPLHHYNTLIKIIQGLTGQNTDIPKREEISWARQYIYGQVKTFNYLLYKRSGWFEATTYTDFLASVKYLVRFTSQALRHLLVWLAAVVLLGGTYLAYIEERYWVVALVAVVFLVPVLYDWYRQIRLHQDLHNQGKRQKVKSDAKPPPPAG
jgi:hypothetical protein